MSYCYEDPKDIYEKFKEVFDEKKIKEVVDMYKLLLERANTVVPDGRFTATGLIIDPEDERVIVDGDYCCCGETCYESYVVPLKWFFLDEDALADEWEAERKRQKAEEEAFRKEEAKHRAEEKEAKDREEYERLKAKYESK